MPLQLAFAIVSPEFQRAHDYLPDVVQYRLQVEAPLKALLKRAQAYYREPDSDRYEFTCKGCRTRSRYGDKHTDDCLVIAIARALG